MLHAACSMQHATCDLICGVKRIGIPLQNKRQTTANDTAPRNRETTEWQLSSGTTMSAPADLGTNLALEPSCTGLLQKQFESSSAKHWEPWHVELRGVYLCYFKDGDASARGKGATSPLGAIDLRQLLSASASGDVHILKARTREICFRADVSSTASSTSATLDEWARCITSVLESEVVEAGAAERPPSSDLKIALSDAFKAPLTCQAQVENPLNSGTAINFTDGSAHNYDSMPSKIPKRMKLMCIACGIVLW